MKKFIIGLVPVFFLFFACKKENLVLNYSFDRINDRVWVGEDFWSIPMEDWQVKEGRVECWSNIQEASLSLLPYEFVDRKGRFDISFRMGLLKKGTVAGASGIRIASQDDTDSDYRAAAYFGDGINMGVNTDGYAFLNESIVELNKDFDFSDFRINIHGENTGAGIHLTFILKDQKDSVKAEFKGVFLEDTSGIIQLVNNFRTADSKNNGPKFWFDDLIIEAEILDTNTEHRFGPILWTMYTLSEKTMKMSAQFPPVSDQDNHTVELLVEKQDGKWQIIAEAEIDQYARNASFSVRNWNDSIDHAYKVRYKFTDMQGEHQLCEYKGTVKKDPVNKPLEMGALTCQFWTGFPYAPVVKNLISKNADILYFSGDQIYENNGGYGIKTAPEDKAILSYLGKWYMFGWAFGEAMRNVPTICTPDDHDVFQGNLWGGGGKLKSDRDRGRDDMVGFDQTILTVNAVNRTQCAHLPDPVDQTPSTNGLVHWFTQLKYGRVSFAIVSDRVYKSGPEAVANWEGRLDLIKDPLKDPSVLNKPGLSFLGDQQELFLNKWVTDWTDVDMKVLLSQTVFANATTHYGRFDNYLTGDMDSGGWPQKSRDTAVEIIRKGYAFHVVGDQHLPSIVQYGIDDYRDAGWCFCVPAISICYSRWFRPDELKRPVVERPAHGFPNTGLYTDYFGNKNFVYAVGNPGDFVKVPNRYEFENSKSAGFGFVTFDQQSRNISMESWKMLGDADSGEMKQHDGWPLTINQFDNDGRKAVAWLPTLEIMGNENPVLEVTNQDTNELEYMVRIKGRSFEPKVFSRSTYKIRVGYPETNKWKVVLNIKAQEKKPENSMNLNLNDIQ